MVFVVTSEYGYVLSTLFASTLVNLWHQIQVGQARKAAQIQYPTMYATAAEADADPAKHKFNCVQRAHGNYLEQLPNFALLSLISGIEYPRATAGLGAMYLAGRIIYAIGYKNSPRGTGGKGRYKGVWYNFALLGLMGTSATTLYHMLA